MNRHAYLILAYSEPDQLQKIINLLDDDRYDIYIHIDKKNKYKFEQTQLKTNKASLYVCSKVKVNWGGYSIVEAELIILKEALKKEHSYYHLISGEDFPIKSNDYIYSYFESKYPAEYILFRNEVIDNKSLDRVKYYHLFSESYRFFRLDNLNRIVHGLDRIIVFLQNALGFVRKRKLSSFQRGSQWFSITEDLAKCIVENINNIEHDFHYTLIPDEMVVQTIASSCGYISRCNELQAYNLYEQNMRLVNWGEFGDGPYYFSEEDYDYIMDTKYLFARKISYERNPKLVDMIYDRVMEKNGKGQKKFSI